MDYCHVEFEPKDEPSRRRLVEFFAMLKTAKESTAHPDEGPLIEYLSEAERSYFWNPSPEELAEWNEEWFSAPLPKRHSAEMAMPPWDLESLLEAFWNGDYELVGVLSENNRHFIAFNPHGYPYGGTGSLIALAESFGHKVLGVEDGTGYVSYVPEAVWKPRARREL